MKSLNNDLLRSELQEKRRTETKRALKMDSQARLRQTLDQQRAVKEQTIRDIKEEEKEIVKLGVKREQETDQQRSEFLNKIKQLRVTNDK